MKLRVFLFEDNAGIRKLIASMLSSRGYEVFSYDHPQKCSILKSDKCECDHPYQCADILLCDRFFYNEDCIDFLKDQISRKCRARFFGIMSAALGYEDIEWAEENNVKVLKKPFLINNLSEWLDYCETNSNSERKLTKVA